MLGISSCIQKATAACNHIKARWVFKLPTPYPPSGLTSSTTTFDILKSFEAIFNSLIIFCILLIKSVEDAVIQL
jgi:hypothetical protein